MRANAARLLGFAILVAISSVVSVSARADDKTSIELGRACGPDRYGRPLHFQFSKNDKLCVYLANPVGTTNCKPPVTSPDDKTAMWDEKNGVCKQISATYHVECASGTAVFYADEAPASGVSGVASFAVATAVGGGQVCLTASGPYSGTSSYTGPCGIPNTTALYTKLNAAGQSQGLTVTPDAAKIPGYGSGYVNGLGTFACVAASKPGFKKYPDPGIGRFIPAE